MIDRVSRQHSRAVVSTRDEETGVENEVVVKYADGVLTILVENNPNTRIEIMVAKPKPRIVFERK